VNAKILIPILILMVLLSPSYALELGYGGSVPVNLNTAAAYYNTSVVNGSVSVDITSKLAPMDPQGLTYTMKLTPDGVKVLASGTYDNIGRALMGVNITDAGVSFSTPIIAQYYNSVWSDLVNAGAVSATATVNPIYSSSLAGQYVIVDGHLSVIAGSLTSRSLNINTTQAYKAWAYGDVVNIGAITLNGATLVNSGTQFLSSPVQTNNTYGMSVNGNVNQVAASAYAYLVLYGTGITTATAANVNVRTISVVSPDAQLSVIVDDYNGNPISGAIVKVDSVQVGTTDSNGLFSETTSVGSHTVSVGKPGYSPKTADVSVTLSGASQSFSLYPYGQDYVFQSASFSVKNIYEGSEPALSLSLKATKTNSYSTEMSISGVPEVLSVKVGNSEIAEVNGSYALGDITTWTPVIITFKPTAGSAQHSINLNLKGNDGLNDLTGSLEFTYSSLPLPVTYSVPSYVRKGQSINIPFDSSFGDIIPASAEIISNGSTLLSNAISLEAYGVGNLSLSTDNLAIGNYNVSVSMTVNGTVIKKNFPVKVMDIISVTSNSLKFSPGKMASLTMVLYNPGNQVVNYLVKVFSSDISSKPIASQLVTVSPYGTVQKNINLNMPAGASLDAYTATVSVSQDGKVLYNQTITLIKSGGALDTQTVTSPAAPPTGVGANGETTPKSSNTHSKNKNLIYGVLVLLAGFVIAGAIFSRNRKPKYRISEAHHYDKGKGEHHHHDKIKGKAPKNSFKKKGR